MNGDKKRTTILLIALVALAGVVWFTSGGSGGSDSDSPGLTAQLDEMINGGMRSREAAVEELDKKIRDQKKANQKTEKIADRLGFWRRYSLPSDSQVAPLACQSWLNSLLYDCGITGTVKQGATKAAPNYILMEFTVTGRAPYIDWVNFLDIFYREMQLHRIQSISINPINQQDVVDVNMKIQALALTGASRNRMPDQRVEQVTTIADDDEATHSLVQRLSSRNPNDYMVILDRNIFSASVQDDPMDYATLTSITTVNGVPEACFLVQIPVSSQIMQAGGEGIPYEELVRVRPGEHFDIGRFEGKLVEAYDDQSFVILESAPVSEIASDNTPADNTETPNSESSEKNTALPVPIERWLLAVGERLIEAAALPYVE